MRGYRVISLEYIDTENDIVLFMLVEQTCEPPILEARLYIIMRVVH